MGVLSRVHSLDRAVEVSHARSVYRCLEAENQRHFRRSTVGPLLDRSVLGVGYWRSLFTYCPISPVMSCTIEALSYLERHRDTFIKFSIFRPGILLPDRPCCILIRWDCSIVERLSRKPYRRWLFLFCYLRISSKIFRNVGCIDRRSLVRHISRFRHHYDLGRIQKVSQAQQFLVKIRLQPYALIVLSPSCPSPAISYV